MKKALLIFSSFVFAAIGFSQGQCDADFNYSVNGGTVTFTNTSIDLGSTTFNWTFGDGGTSTSENPTYTYTQTGGYTVCLSIVTTDSVGFCQDSFCDTLYVVADTTGGGGSGNGCTVSADFSSSANGTIVGVNTSTGSNSFQWGVYDDNWNFLYATSSTNLNYTPGGYGLFNVCLAGLEDSTQMVCDSTCFQVTLVEDTTGGGGSGCNVSANFSQSGNGTIVGTNTSTGSTSFLWGVYDASWNFLHSSTTTDLNYSPGAYGLYNICLAAFEDSTQMVCDSTCFQLNLYQDTTGGSGTGCSISVDFSQTNNGTTIIGTNTSTGSTSYLWGVYDSGWNFLHSATSLDLNYSPGVHGSYNVCLTGFDDSTQMACDSACFQVVLYPDSVAFVTQLEQIEFSIYPNPAKELVSINADVTSIQQVLIFDLSGREMDRVAIQFEKTQVSVANYPNGLYLIHALDNNGNRVHSEKLIKH